MFGLLMQELKDVTGQVQLSKENSAKIRSAIKELSSMSVDANTFKALNQKIGGIELVNAIKAHANTNSFRTGIRTRRR